MNAEALAWEAAVDERARSRWCNPKGKPFDPRKDALIRHRKRAPWRRLSEAKFARKTHQGRFRMRMKQRLLQDEDWQPVPHDYKTYGWLTW